MCKLSTPINACLYLNFNLHFDSPKFINLNYNLHTNVHMQGVSILRQFKTN